MKVIIAILTVCLAALLLLPACRKSFPELDEQADELATLRSQGFEQWETGIKGQFRDGAAVQRLIQTYAASRSVLKKLEGMSSAGTSPDSSSISPATEDRNFEIRKRNAIDLARGTANCLFGLVSSAEFHNFRLTFEAPGHEETANRLRQSLDTQHGDYARGVYPEGLDGLPPEPGDDSQYVFVILLDATRADHLGCYGYKRPTSPIIDRLAAEGIVFDHAFAQCSTTNTSVASLMTAFYPKTHKMIGSTDWVWEYMLIDAFREAGFTTAGFSANPLIGGEHHFDNGFDHFEELFWNRASITIGQTIRWLERARSGNDKLFAYVHLIDPHDIYLPPMPFRTMFDEGYKMRSTATGIRRLVEKRFKELRDAEPPCPECEYDPMIQFRDQPERFLDCISKVEASLNLTMRDIENMVARYDGEIRYTDTEIGRLLAYLQEEDLLRRSTVVILADHGESFLDHNQLKHGRVLYDNEIHVPLIFWRGQNPFGGRHNTRPAEIIDTMPTLLGLFDIPVPEGLHGRDLRRREASRESDPVYSLTWNSIDMVEGFKLKMTTVREPEFKYIRTLKFANRQLYRDEFYHLASDPGELHDAREEYPEIYERLRTGLETWNRETDRAAPRQVKEGMEDQTVRKLRELGYVE